MFRWTDDMIRFMADAAGHTDDDALCHNFIYSLNIGVER